MSSKRSFLALFAAIGLALLACAAWWIEARAERNAPAAAERTNASSNAIETRSTVALAPQALPTEARTRVRDAQSAQASIPFALDSASWIEGSVELPAGTPADEVVGVAARGFASDSIPAHAHEPNAVQWSGEEPGGERAPIARVRLGADGRFRVPIAQGLRSAAVWLEAHYVYLDEIAEGTPARSLQLSPKLGARWVGRLILPQNLPPDFDRGALAACELRVDGWLPKSAVRRTLRRRAVLDDELRFDCGGLPSELSYVLHFDPLQFTPVAEFESALASGRVTAHDVQLALGARVEGRCVDELGAPVALAEIAVEPRGALGGFDRRAARTPSRADGSFTLRALTPGTWTATAEREGWLGSQTEVLTLTEGERRSELVLRLSRGAIVDGHVSFPDGRAARGAIVQVQENVAREFDGARSWMREKSHRVDVDVLGNFHLGGLGSGPFSVLAEVAEGEASDPTDTDSARRRVWRAQALDARPAAKLELVLAAPIALDGRVVDDLGAPIESFEVDASEVAPAGAAHSGVFAERHDAFEDAHGQFELWLSPGEWRLRASADGHASGAELSVSVPASAPTELVLARDAEIHGIVRDARGDPPDHARVAWSNGAAPRAGAAAIEVAEDGTFAIVGLAPGTLQLFARARGSAQSETLKLELAPGEVRRDLALELRVGGSIAGRILAADGRGDGERTILAMSAGRFDETQATSDAEGRFEFTHLAPGSYQLIAQPKSDSTSRSGRGASERDLASRFGEAKLASVEVRDGETSEVVLGAPPARPVRLRGRVTAAQRAVPRCEVLAVLEGRALLAALKYARTDEAGAYELALDEPGEYTFLVGLDVEAGSGSEFHRTLESAGDQQLDFALPLGRISGRVTADDGTPAAAVAVRLNGARAGSILDLDRGRSAETDELGRFAFEFVSADRYVLRAGAANAARSNVRGFASLGPIEVGEGRAVEGLELRLAVGGRVVGSARFVDGRPAASAAIFARDASGLVVDPFSSVESDASGRFEYAGLAPGSYTFIARVDHSVSRESSPVELAPDRGAATELVLEHGSSLAVRIVDSKSAAPRARFDVLDERGRSWSELQNEAASERALSRGLETNRVHFGPLPSGRYRASATLADGRTQSSTVVLDGASDAELELRFDP